jgi:sugar/nucleoside kinase (ribokinase family)
LSSPSFCKPENLSSKSASISANFISEESYPGGAWAVVLHIAELGCKVDAVIPIGDDFLTEKVIEEMPKYKNLNSHYVRFKNLKTPLKTRFISPSGNQRMFELTHLDNFGWSNSDWNQFIKNFNSVADDNDLLIALDFGHGMWEYERLDFFSGLNIFKALNVQTNSGNYGFNLYHKHKYFDYLVLDERELRLGMHDRAKDKYELAKNIAEKINCDYSITLGAEGSVHFSSSDNFSMHYSPIFFTDPIDTVGAGDAYFAITALLKKNGSHPEIIPFVGNIYAGLKTKIMGNKKPVTKVDLLRSITSILG